MSKIKENPIKYAKLFSLMYLAINTVLRVIYYIVISIMFSTSITFSMLIGIVISNIPTIIFTIHIFAFYGTNKTQLLLPISYIVSVAMSLFNMVQSVDNVASAVSGSVVSVILDIVGIGISVFLIVDCFSNFKRLRISKKLVIISAGISCFAILLDIVISVIGGYALYGFYIVSILISLTSIIGMITRIIFWNYAIDKSNVLSMEDTLLLLKQQYESGLISEKDFNQRKTDILSKL